MRTRESNSSPHDKEKTLTEWLPCQAWSCILAPTSCIKTGLSCRSVGRAIAIFALVSWQARNLTYGRFSIAEPRRRPPETTVVGHCQDTLQATVVADAVAAPCYWRGPGDQLTIAGRWQDFGKEWSSLHSAEAFALPKPDAQNPTHVVHREVFQASIEFRTHPPRSVRCPQNGHKPQETYSRWCRTGMQRIV